MIVTSPEPASLATASCTAAGPRYFFGHHKCATGWIDGILREVCFRLGWEFSIVHNQVNFAAYGTLPRYVQTVQPDVLAYTNADIQHVRQLPAVRGFHVVRDPRDLLVSAYFSHLHSHPSQNWPSLEMHRERLQKVSKEEGLFQEFTFSRRRLEQLYNWDYTQPGILELKLEEISPRPLAAFARIFSHLGMLDEAAPSTSRRLKMQLNTLNQRGRRFLPGRMALWPFRFPQQRLPEPTLASILERKSFKRLSGGRKQGEEDVRSHYRKGTPGDWKNHFTPEHVALFKREYNDVLVKLGYETDDRW